MIILQIADISSLCRPKLCKSRQCIANCSINDTYSTKIVILYFGCEREKPRYSNISEVGKNFVLKFHSIF